MQNNRDSMHWMTYLFAVKRNVFFLILTLAALVSLFLITSFQNMGYYIVHPALSYTKLKNILHSILTKIVDYEFVDLLLQITVI